MSTEVAKLMKLLQTVAAMSTDLKAWYDEKVDLDDVVVNSARLEGKTFEELSDVVGADLTAAIALLEGEVLAYVARRDNPHEVTKDQVGLGNVVDMATATPAEAVAAAIDTKRVTAEGLGAFWANLVGGAPESLDTLHEIAAAFQNNPDVINLIEGTVTANQTLVIALQQSRVDQLAHIDDNYTGMNTLVSQMKESLRGLRGDRV